MTQRLMSLLGLFVMIGLAWLLSSHRKRMHWRILGGGLALQFLFAGLVLWTPPGLSQPIGKPVLVAADKVFRALLVCVDAGSTFLFGAELTTKWFAFGVLPTIIFFSALMAIFYHLGIMQWIVGLFAKMMQKTLGTSGAETLSAAANVFVGQTEAPLVIRPYISSMTLSELNALMVGGFATIAGGVLAAYVKMGISAQDLLAASIISAPAALLIAKVMQPEVDQPKTLGTVQIQVERTEANILEAITKGTVDGLRLALNVGAMLLVFLALIAVVNELLGWTGQVTGALLGGWLDNLFGTSLRYDNWSLELILGHIFAPLAWLMGIEPRDCFRAGELLGLKMVTNEFLAYRGLADIKPLLSDRTVAILTYALCGFANFSSIGIQLGGIGGIAPERRADLAKLGLRAMIGGTLATFMTACVAGVLLDK